MQSKNDFVTIHSRRFRQRRNVQGQGNVFGAGEVQQLISMHKEMAMSSQLKIQTWYMKQASEMSNLTKIQPSLKDYA